MENWNLGQSVATTGVHTTGAQVPATNSGRKTLELNQGSAALIGGLALYGALKLVRGVVSSIHGYANYQKQVLAAQAQVLNNPAQAQVPPQPQQVPPQQQAAQAQAAPQGAPQSQQQ